MYELVVGKTTVKYKGTFELDDVYNLTKKIFENRDYSVGEESVDKEENPATGTATFKIEFKSGKVLDSYSKSVCETNFTVDSYAKQEIFEGGHKVVKGMGELEVEMKMILQLDYDDKWNVGILGNLRPVFEKVWYKDKKEGWQKKLSIELNNLRDDLKELFSS